MAFLGDRLQVQQQVPGEVRTVESLEEPAHLLGALLRGGNGGTDPQPEAVPAPGGPAAPAGCVRSGTVHSGETAARRDGASREYAARGPRRIGRTGTAW
ncbi:hypothetical protein ACIGBH_26325 [Streptomyces sp. NPDC085929]|uniref:hypothetical protein n=1 Tax=Streptomyces sp. NPDC085929 TaxID=3365739 RepID=UPI0037D90209